MKIEGGESKEQKLLSDIISSVGSAIEVNVDRVGNLVDYIISLNVGHLTSVRLGVIIDDDELDRIAGRAILAKNKFMLDKVIIVSDNEALRYLGETIKWIVIVSYSDLIKKIKSLAAVEEGKMVDKIKYIEPVERGDPGYVIKLAEKHRGRIIKKGDFAGARAAYIPLLCYSIHLHSIDYTPLILETEMVDLCFDGITGSLLTFDEGIRLAGVMQRLGELGDDAIDVLRRVAELGEASLSELKEEFKGKVDVEAVVDVLIERGLIEPSGPDTYKAAVISTDRIKNPVDETLKLGSTLREGKPPCELTLRPYISHTRLISILEVFGTVKARYLLYYPVYFIVYTKSSGKRTIEITIIVDAVTSKRLGEIEELVSESPAVSVVDSIVDDVAAKGGVKLC